MILIPELGLGWLNGWIPLCLMYLVIGILMLVFPKNIVKRLYDKTGRNPRPRFHIITGKLLALGCYVLIILTPLKIGDPFFILGIALFAVGLSGFAIALFNFKDTPMNQPVTRGLYKLSRNPQIFMLTISLLGISIAMGSWISIFLLLVAQPLSHSRILAEENACLAQYGDSYRDYMTRIPRYFLFF